MSEKALHRRKFLLKHGYGGYDSPITVYDFSEGYKTGPTPISIETSLLEPSHNTAIYMEYPSGFQHPMDFDDIESDVWRFDEF